MREMSERQTGMPQVRYGAWVRVDDPTETPLWFYTARPERYADEPMYERPPQLAKDAD